MKLSPAMINMLKNIKRMQGPNITAGRPMHHGNRVTWDALIKRGLITEDDTSFHAATITEKGKTIHLE